RTLRATVDSWLLPDGFTEHLKKSAVLSPTRQRGCPSLARRAQDDGLLTMIIVVRPNSTPEQIDHILKRIQELGYRPHVSEGKLRTIIGVIGDENKLQAEPLAAIPGVEQVLPILKPFKLASREFHPHDSVVEVGGPSTGTVRIGDGSLAMIAGPCAIESAEVLDEIAGQVKRA